MNFSTSTGWRWRRSVLACAALVATCAMATLSEFTQADTLSFHEALALALQETPALKANAAAVDAARHAVMPAGELPDPKLAVGIDNLPIEGDDRFSLTSDFMTMQRIGVMQDFPNREKREARLAAARGRFALAEANTDITHLMVVRETAASWINRYTTEQQLALIDDLLDENQLLQQAVSARVAAGQTGEAMNLASDIVMPRQEAAMIDERRDELIARRQQSIAMLQRWVGSSATVPLSGKPPEWTITRELLTTGLHKHPDLQIFEPQARVLDAEVAEATAAKKPDWALAVGYQKRGSAFGDMITLEVSADLPVFTATRQDPQIAAKRAERLALDAEREAVLREHSAMLEMELAEYQRMAKAVRRQREVLLPLANEKVTLALVAWQNLKGSLMDLIAARRERIDTELQAIALEGERQQMAAELYYTYGNHTDPLNNSTEEHHRSSLSSHQQGAQP